VVLNHTMKKVCVIHHQAYEAGEHCPYCTDKSVAKQAPRKVDWGDVWFFSGPWASMVPIVHKGGGLNVWLVAVNTVVAGRYTMFFYDAYGALVHEVERPFQQIETGNTVMLNFEFDDEGGLSDFGCVVYS
jgi:hypothetical protein